MMGLGLLIAALPAFALNGARIPSMAEDVATERSTLDWRVSGSRMKTFVSESLRAMGGFYRRKICAGES